MGLSFAVYQGWVKNLGGETNETTQNWTDTETTQTTKTIAKLTTTRTFNESEEPLLTNTGKEEKFE